MRKNVRICRLLLLFLVGFMLVGMPARQTFAKAKISKTSMILKKGKKKRLKITGSAEKVIWSSSNKKVATVSRHGKVTAVKGGNATIKAKVGAHTMKCKVKVVSLNYSKYTLKSVGSTKKLKVTNGKKTKWKSSNEAVVTVSKSGKMTAVGGGTAKIICSSRGMQFICKVFVPVVNTTSQRLKPGKTFTFKVSKTSEKASYSSSDTGVLSVDKNTGKCKAIAHGSAYACAKADGYIYKCYVIVEKEGDIVTPRSMIESSTKGETYRQMINTGDYYRAYMVFHQTSANGFKSKITQVVEDSGSGSTETSGTTGTTGATGTEDTSGEGGEEPVEPDDPAEPEPVITKTYNLKNYISNHGCAACATTTVLSGYLMEKQTPVNTVQNLEYEAFGYEKWDDNYNKDEEDRMPLSLSGISQLLEKNGIRNTYKYTYSRPAVLTQIRDHLLKGKPVVITVGATRYDGVKDGRWTGGRHTMVLLGMTDHYKVIVADSADRASTFGNMRRIKLVDLNDICGYLFKTTDTSKLGCPYYTKYKYCGGYILVDAD